MAVSKSTDGGTTWERDTLTTDYCMCYALAVDKSNSNVVYAGGYNGRLFKTTNGGVTWFSSATGLSGSVYDIKIGSTKANTVYAGTSSGVFKSTNAGASWTNTGLSASVNAVLINPSNENEIYAATSNGIYKSTTGGGGWTLMNTGLLNTNTTSLGIYPNNWLFCGTNGTGMYRWNIQVGAEEYPGERDPQKILLNTLPNPFKNTTNITFQNPANSAIRNSQSEISLRVYDASGRLVKNLLPTTYYLLPINTVVWNGTDESGEIVPAGVYFVHLEIDNQKLIEKVIKIQ